MTTFLILHKGEEVDFEKVVFIKEGFSVYAFVLGILWLIVHRLWRPLLVIMGLNFLLTLVLGANSLGSYYAMLIVSFYTGCMANDWLQMKLLRSDYQLIDIVMASDLEEAQYKFLQRRNKRHEACA